VQVRDGLAHAVVHGDERAARIHGGLDHRCDPLHTGEVPLKLIGWQIGECLDMAPRHDEDMARKQRHLVEEGHRHLVGKHHVRL
jgi:hypothetical protein